MSEILENAVVVEITLDFSRDRIEGWELKKDAGEIIDYMEMTLSGTNPRRVLYSVIIFIK